MRALCSALLLMYLVYADSKEDAVLLNGADSLYHGDFAGAFDELIALFEDTKEPYYAKLAAQAAMGKGDTKSALLLAELYIKLSGNDEDLIINKILADVYAQNGQIEQAIKVLERIYAQEPSNEVGEVLGNMYMLKGSPKQAQPIFARLYEATHHTEILKKLLLAFIAQKQEQKALGLLSQHLLSFGCEERFCEEAIGIYADLRGLEFAKDVFEKIYTKNPTIPNAMNLMRVLIALKQFQEAQGIAQAFPFDQGLLLDLYVMQGDYHKAQKEAKHIYAQSKNPKFLALEAIYEFSAQEQPTRKLAESVAKKLNEAITLRQAQAREEDQQQTPQDAFFYNFYGYLLIDYELNIKRGVEYVKKALAIESYAFAYIDSLAWGYYKLGDCENALKAFAQIPKDQIANNPDLRAHSYQIEGVCGKQDITQKRVKQ